MRKKIVASIPVVLLILAVMLTLAVPFVAAGDPENTQGFRKGVTLAGIREHQAAFQSFANANGGNRLASTAGHDASAQYVYDRAVAAGYNVHFQEFEFLLVSDRT